MDKGASPHGDRATQATPQAPAGLGHPVSIPSAGVWPEYEMRPLPEYTRGTVLRYAEGAWIPDDGEWDLAFVCYGSGAPFALGVELPYQRNIVWSGLTSHWSASDYDHPRANPWHYLLREGETEWGGAWERDRHPNRRAFNAAMSKCSSINRCANGRGPKFEDGDRFIAAGLLRERSTQVVVTPPATRHCMFCGAGWEHKASAMSADTAETAQQAQGDSPPARPAGDAQTPPKSSQPSKEGVA